MSPAAYVAFAIILSMFLAWLAARVIMRNAAMRDTGRPSILTVILAVGSWGFLSFVALSLALSTTNTVQTAIIVSNMEQNPPFAAIAAHDPVERARLRDAVSAGLERADGKDIKRAVIDAVSAELKPYMNKRLSTASDSVYLALAPIVADALTKSSTMGRCIVPGDRNGADLRRDLDPERIMRWSETLVSSPPAISVSPSDPVTVERFRTELVTRAVAAGVDRDAAVAAITPNAPGTARCVAAAKMLRMAAADADRRRGTQDIRLLLTGFQLPG